LHRGESGALFAIAPRPAHFEKTKRNARRARSSPLRHLRLFPNPRRESASVPENRKPQDHFDPAAFEFLTNQSLATR
jgi:hypothetical protein